MAKELEERLHDEIDEQEDLRNEAASVVESVKPHLADLVNDIGDATEALEAIAVLVEAKLAGRDGLLRKSMRTGFAAAKRRPPARRRK